MRVPVCLSVCFCGLNPRTVLQLSLNKFRAPHGYRGFVLGLNVSISFVLWVLGMEHVQSSPPSGSRRHNSYVTKKCGQCWPILDTGFCACMFYFLGVAVDAT